MADDPLVMPRDEFGLVKGLRERISAAIETAWWSSQPASPAVMEVIAPLIARAERAEATVDAVYEYCTTYRGDPGMTLACEDILGIIGGEEGAGDA